jgi:hypothetical protein
MAKFNVQAARKAGYSDAEIADYLAKEGKFNAANARQSGYSDGEIIAFLTGGAKAAPKAAPPVSRIGAAVSGFERGLKPVADIARAVNPLSYLQDAFLGTEGRDAMERQLAAAGAQAQQARPNYFAGGKIAGEIAGTTPVIMAGGGLLSAAGRAAGAVAPRVGAVAERVGRAVQTGGIGSGRTAAQTAAMPLRQRQAQLLERTAGAAIAGAGGAALTGQDAGEGAAFSAGIPAAGTIARKLAGLLPDLTKLPTLQAARLIRESLGDNIDAARAAVAALPANAQELVRQTLVKAGVEPRTFMGLAADVEKLRPDQVGNILEGQAAAREARLAGAAGGADATAVRAAAEMARRDVSRATGPSRESALDRANVAGREVPRAEQLAAQARAQADEMTATGFVPRMRGLEDRSRGQIDAAFQNPEFFTLGGPVNRIGEIAEGAGQRADNAITAQLGLRQTARDMEDYVADLAAQGMQPLTVAPITQSIRAMAAAPGTRASKLQRRALVTAANQLDALANANGVIDARDLYQFRKSELGDIVNVLLSGRNMPPSGVKEGAAKLMGSIRPMIDDAIEGAGGAGFKDYLDLTRRGFEAVNRQELGGKAAQLAKDNPNEFIALMRGERPQIVEDVMGKGTGQYDIYGMALADPNRFLALKQSADELGVLNRMGELSSQGSAAATELIGRERPLVSRALTRAGLAAFPPARIGADAAQMALASALGPRVRQNLAEAVTSGPNMLALMNQYPSSLRMSEAVSQLSPGMRNALAQLLRGGTMNNQ